MKGQRGRKPHVVDTNVVVVANRQGDFSYKCANACANALLEIKKTGILVIEDGGRILDEYSRYCAHSGQPGVGDAFFRWVHDNQGREDLVHSVPITPKGDNPNDFEEFPDHEGLSNFDPSDRKFVAVANAHPEKPPILQGTDSKWWGWKDSLKASGINVVFLCPTEVEETYIRKFGG
jgi:hypothetical protein